jgi:hypothetical protein
MAQWGKLRKDKGKLEEADAGHRTSLSHLRDYALTFAGPQMQRAKMTSYSGIKRPLVNYTKC